MVTFPYSFTQNYLLSTMIYHSVYLKHNISVRLKTTNQPRRVQFQLLIEFAPQRYDLRISKCLDRDAKPRYERESMAADVPPRL